MYKPPSPLPLNKQSINRKKIKGFNITFSCFVLLSVKVKDLNGVLMSLVLSYRDRVTVCVSVYLVLVLGSLLKYVDIG